MSYFDTLKQLREKANFEETKLGFDKIVESSKTKQGILERPVNVKRGTPTSRVPVFETSEPVSNFLARMEAYYDEARHRVREGGVGVLENDYSKSYEVPKFEQNLGTPQLKPAKKPVDVSSFVPEQSPSEIVSNLKLTSKLVSVFTPPEVLADQEFMSEVERVSQKWGFNPNDLMAVINFETGGTFDPSVKNQQKGSTATGLIQFLSKTAKGLGTSVEELAQMSRSEQMFYVDKYLEQFGEKAKGASLEDLYMLVLRPASTGQSPKSVLFSSGTKEYTANEGLDENKDGVVTVAEATNRVRRSAGLMQRRNS